MNKIAKIVITVSLIIVTLAIACLAIYVAIVAPYLHIKIIACINLMSLGIGFACSVNALYPKEDEILIDYKIRNKALKIALDKADNDLIEFIDKIKSCKSITQVRKILDEKT